MKFKVQFSYVMGMLLALMPLLQNCDAPQPVKELTLNKQGYFETQGLNIMVFSDYYPEGHQGGVSIIQNGDRVATNGDIRLEATPGQWQPLPKPGERVVDTVNNEIRAKLLYPDSSRHLVGFNPATYPDLYFNYEVKVKPEGTKVRIIVDLDREIPEEFIGQVGFNMELFPTPIFGKTYYMDGQSGMFPRQANGPMVMENDTMEMTPMAIGKKLVICPDDEARRLTIETLNGELELIDGRGIHNNGWFVVRSTIASGATTGAIEWVVDANIIPGWVDKPVIQVSQVGYHPKQQKIANVELDKYDKNMPDVSLQKVQPDGTFTTVKKEKSTLWGQFLRYNYVQFDFSDVEDPGLYQIWFGNEKSHTFEIKTDIFDRHVWQPTLEYFLPVQMCHMRINDRYKVWHGVCHLDDALMAPTDINHFDGYVQGSSTLTKYKSGDIVPGLNSGGWHDAGDYDLRVESQAGTVKMLALAVEEFGVDYDQTAIDQKSKIVEMHKPDGVPDAIQQIEHGLLTILGGYRSMGRLYRGIICPDLRQYVMLGDAASMTDNKFKSTGIKLQQVSTFNNNTTPYDDRWVFTEVNPFREIGVVASLAISGRVMEKYNPALAKECITTAEALWDAVDDNSRADKTEAAVELLKSTGKDKYRAYLLSRKDRIIKGIGRSGWIIARGIEAINDAGFTEEITKAIDSLHMKVESERQENPYGVPYKPNIWGAGWGIQTFGVQQYFLHKGFPEIFSTQYMLHAMNFVLGVHPGANNASFASGVGSKSLIVAYGVNRDEWSYIPGGVGSGTALIRPDFPELKEWPYFWQQTEYVMGGGATDFMFLVLAAQHTLK